MTETVSALFQSLELPEEAFEDFKTQLSGVTATEAINTPKYLQAQIKEVLNSTWFMIPGCHELTEARRGPRPGDSMADLLFTIAFRHLLAKVQEQLRQEGVLVELWWTGHKEPLQSSDNLQRLDMLLVEQMYNIPTLDIQSYLLRMCLIGMFLGSSHTFSGAVWMYRAILIYSKKVTDSL